MDKLINYLQKNIGENARDNTLNYYEWIVEQFDLYLQTLNKSIIDSNFGNFLQETNEFIGSPTKKRFLNLVRKIQSQCLEILNLCYKGDFINATEKLLQLLTDERCTQFKLKDSYCNYFCIDFERLKAKYFYRRVDFDNECKDVNCWHVPFQLRHLAAKGRFNMLGYPCFYLADSPQVAYAEVGKLEKGKTPYMGKFELKKKCYLLNLTLTKVEEMTNYDKFCFLITYPFHQLCLAKAKHKNAPFCEEYIFSQLFFHLIFFHHENGGKNGLCTFDGISYNSLEYKNNKGVCVVIPASYQGSTPPKKGYSPLITSMFNPLEVVAYNE